MMDKLESEQLVTLCCPVKTKTINGGFDIKLINTYPFPHNSRAEKIISRGQWENFISRVNRELIPHRTKVIDFGLLIATLPPFLLAFALRRKRRARRRRACLEKASRDFNFQYEKHGITLIYEHESDPRLRLFIKDELPQNKKQKLVYI